MLLWNYVSSFINLYFIVSLLRYNLHTISVDFFSIFLESGNHYYHLSNFVRLTLLWKEALLHSIHFLFLPPLSSWNHQSILCFINFSILDNLYKWNNRHTTFCLPLFLSYLAFFVRISHYSPDHPWTHHCSFLQCWRYVYEPAHLSYIWVTSLTMPERLIYVSNHLFGLSSNIQEYECNNIVVYAFINWQLFVCHVYCEFCCLEASLYI